MGLMDGVSIIDITDGLAGPLATQVMADCGADIVRVDRPGASRSPAELVRLRGRRSIVVSCDTAEGEAFVSSLVARSDVLITEPGIDGARRFPPGHDTMAAANPRLITLRIEAYGSDGPLAASAAHDHLVAARYGVYDQPGWRAGPTFLPFPVPSIGAALLAMQGIGTALYSRERTGAGQEVSTSLLAGALAFQPGIVSMSDGLPPGATPAGDRRPQGVQPFYSLYECADGEWLHFGCLSTQFQMRAIQAVGLADEMAELGFGTPAQRDNNPSIIAAIRDRMLERPFDAWAALFETQDVPYARSQWTEELFDDPQVQHDGLIAGFDDPTTGAVIQQMASVLGGPPGSWRQPAPCPTPGQHTDEVCRELGLDEARIEALRRAGVIA